MIAWDDLRLIRAIAETRSLAGAAEALAVNHSTIFRRLGALEQALGTRLFERARSGYVATTAGEEVTRLAERMADDIAAMERRITGHDLRPSGELRVTTTDTLLLHLLTPVFASFRAAYPEIRLEVILSNQSVSLTKRDADVAIRASDRPGDTLVGRRVASHAWAVYGPASMAGAPSASINELRRHNWVGFAEPLAGIKAAKWLRERVGDDHVVYRINSLVGLAEAVVAGVGLAVLPCFVGGAIPGLVRLGGQDPELDTGLWVLTHPDIRQTARVRCFMEHAGRELSRRRATIEGRPESDLIPDAGTPLEWPGDAVSPDRESRS